MESAQSAARRKLIAKRHPSPCLERIAADYLDGQRFREMLLRKDSEKLERIVAIVKAREGKPIKILMDVAEVLNDSAGTYDEMEASAKRKAAEVETHGETMFTVFYVFRMHRRQSRFQTA